MKEEIQEQVSKIGRAMEQEGGKLSNGTLRTLRSIAEDKVSTDEVRKMYDKAIENYNMLEQVFEKDMVKKRYYGTKKTI